jgi:hypothetical protein
MSGGGLESGFLIDLGVDFELVPERPWTPSWRKLLRRLRLAVPACAVLLLVAAAVPAAVHPLRLLARVPLGLDPDVMVVGDDLYVYDVSGDYQASGYSNTVRDYRLDDGGLRWSASLPELPPETTMTYVDGRVIVSMTATDAQGEHTAALDARTGRRLWASDLGSAVRVAGGMLVESTPPPPGFNFVGTSRTTSFRLLDAQTGRVRWSVDLDGDCLARTGGPAGGPADVLVALCASAARLTEIDLADGTAVTTRTVDLGDPGRNFLLPAADRLAEPQLAVVGDTVLVAHAHAPVPAVDAYAMTGLVPRWTGVPVLAGQHLDRCGADLCVLDADGAGPLVDPRTGAPVGQARPRPGPADGALVLAPPGAGDAAARAVPAVPAGTSMALPRADPAHAGGGAVVLARWHAGGPPDPVTILSGVRTPSCLQPGGYLACATTAGALALWRL